MNKMDNIIIQADADGHHVILSKRNLKYNRLISDINASYLLRKNTVIINNSDVLNVIIESDNCGNNIVKSFDEYGEEEIDENIFQNILKKTRKKADSQSNSIEAYLSEKREKLQEKLKTATKFYHKCNYHKAIELYECALDEISKDSYPDEYMLNKIDIFAINFALVLSNIEVRDYKRLKSAEETLNFLAQNHGGSFPSIYYYLGIVYYEFDYYDKAVKILKDGMKVLEKIQTLQAVNWPGTDDIMVEKLNKVQLLDSMIKLSNDCIIYHPPDNKCLFSSCEFNNKIYFTNPNFNGFVSVICTNKCYFSYHTVCWKKKLKQESIKTKSLLNLICPTDDCGGAIDKISTFDENLKLVNCTSNENAQAQNTKTKNGYPCNPVYKDHKFKINKDETNKSNSTYILKDKEDAKQDSPGAQKQIKSQSRISEQNSSIRSPNGFMIKSKLNSNAKEYVPQPRKMCDKFVKKAENNITQAEYDTLKCDTTILRAELFQTEESYNDLLSRYESLKLENELNKKTFNDFSTQTEPIACKTCLFLEKEIVDKNINYDNLCGINEKLKCRIKELEHELNEIKTSRLFDREMYSRAEDKFLQSNKILMHKLQEEKNEKDKLWHELNEVRKRQDPNKVCISKDVLVQQVLHIKNFYMSYINMFQNKCKHMIWELEDIKALTTADTLPSFCEVEDNLLMWKQALESALKNHGYMIEFYNKTAQSFAYNCESPIASPIPNLIPEPPSVILRHFKSFFLLNKRLEQDLNRHMTNYYKMLSIPCTVMQNTQTAKSELRNEDLHTPTPPEVQKLENKEQDVAVNSNLEESGKEEATADVEEAPQQTVDLENIADKTENVKQEKTPETSTPIHSKQIVGPDGLLQKLQQKCPLTPTSILQEAIKILREARGGLSGLDSKTLMTELKIIITDLTKKERRKPGYPKVAVPEKPNPWAPINNEVSWHNANPRGDCTICFEKMARSNSTQLKCQHVFHTNCVKKWLQSNGICPICRSFTTLDTEFPPLK